MSSRNNRNKDQGHGDDIPEEAFLEDSDVLTDVSEEEDNSVPIPRNGTTMSFTEVVTKVHLALLNNCVTRDTESESPPSVEEKAADSHPAAKSNFDEETEKKISVKETEKGISEKEKTPIRVSEKKETSIKDFSEKEETPIRVSEKQETSIKDFSEKEETTIKVFSDKEVPVEGVSEKPEVSIDFEKCEVSIEISEKCEVPVEEASQKSGSVGEQTEEKISVSGVSEKEVSPKEKSSKEKAESSETSLTRISQMIGLLIEQIKAILEVERAIACFPLIDQVKAMLEAELAAQPVPVVLQKSEIKSVAEKEVSLETIPLVADVESALDAETTARIAPLIDEIKFLLEAEISSKPIPLVSEVKSVLEILDFTRLMSLISDILSILEDQEPAPPVPEVAKVKLVLGKKAFTKCTPPGDEIAPLPEVEEIRSLGLWSAKKTTPFLGADSFASGPHVGGVPIAFEPYEKFHEMIEKLESDVGELSEKSEDEEEESEEEAAEETLEDPCFPNGDPLEREDTESDSEDESPTSTVSTSNTNEELQFPFTYQSTVSTFYPSKVKTLLYDAEIKDKFTPAPEKPPYAPYYYFDEFENCFRPFLNAHGDGLENGEDEQEDEEEVAYEFEAPSPENWEEDPNDETYTYLDETMNSAYPRDSVDMTVSPWILRGRPEEPMFDVEEQLAHFSDFLFPLLSISDQQEIIPIPLCKKNGLRVPELYYLMVEFFAQMSPLHFEYCHRTPVGFRACLWGTRFKIKELILQINLQFSLLVTRCLEQQDNSQSWFYPKSYMDQKIIPDLIRAGQRLALSSIPNGNEEIKLVLLEYFSKAEKGQLMPLVKFCHGFRFSRKHICSMIRGLTYQWVPRDKYLRFVYERTFCTLLKGGDPLVVSVQRFISTLKRKNIWIPRDENTPEDISELKENWLATFTLGRRRPVKLADDDLAGRRKRKDPFPQPEKDKRRKR